MKSRMRRTLVASGVLAATVVSGIGVAQAGTTNRAYNTTVACCNGSGYTAYQKQATSGATGQLHSDTVGGDKVVDVRMDGPSNSDWIRNVTDSDSRRLTGNDNKSGSSVRLQFSNDLTTTVAVQVTGTWRTN